MGPWPPVTLTTGCLTTTRPQASSPHPQERERQTHVLPKSPLINMTGPRTLPRAMRGKQDPASRKPAPVRTRIQITIGLREPERA